MQTKTIAHRGGKSLPERLLEENTQILAGFTKDGVDLTKTREIDFCITLKNKDFCKLARQIYRDKYDMPNGGMFIVVDDPEGCELVLSVKSALTAEFVTDIEDRLIDVAKEFEDAEVYWGFE